MHPVLMESILLTNFIHLSFIIFKVKSMGALCYKIEWYMIKSRLMHFPMAAKFPTVS
jgi:hypothetical protein